MKNVFKSVEGSSQSAVFSRQFSVSSGQFSVGSMQLDVCSYFRKTLKVLLFVHCLLLSVTASTQIYPVQVTPQIVPPYSFKLSDYTTTTQEKLFLNLLLTDAQESGRQVRLKLFVEGPGINFQST
ncbi:MAG: hypothetical protein ABGX00_00580, partial [Allomuricauda sp.]